MNTKKFENFPEYAVTYCAYGDKDGLSDEDIQSIDSFMAENGLDHLVDVGEDRHFSNSPEFGLPCTTVEATFISAKSDEDYCILTDEDFEKIYESVRNLRA